MLLTRGNTDTIRVSGACPDLQAWPPTTKHELPAFTLIGLETKGYIIELRGCIRVPCERTDFMKLHHRSFGIPSDVVEPHGRNP